MHHLRNLFVLNTILVLIHIRDAGELYVKSTCAFAIYNIRSLLSDLGYQFPGPGRILGY